MSTAKNNQGISQFFSHALNAPLSNVQWSWGSENNLGVYLRAWQVQADGDRIVICDVGPNDSRPGLSERLRQITSIKQGKPGYIVLITQRRIDEDGAWRIERYDECLYRILEIEPTLNEQITARVDFANPIYPEHIGAEIDIAGIRAALVGHEVAEETFAKALIKGWTPTQLNSSDNAISFISRDGKQTAKLMIASGKWVR